MMSRMRMLLLYAVAASAVAQGGTSALEQHIGRAQEAQARQDCGTAAREYAAAVKLLPSSGELRANQGIALYCNDQFSDASAALHKSLQLAPALAAPHLFLGLSAFRLSDQEEALRELRTATRLMPGDPTALLWLGYAYLAERKSEEAVREFDEVLRVQPNNVDARYALGETYFEIGRAKALELEKLAPAGRGVRQLTTHQQALLGKSGVTSDGDSQHWSSAREELLYNEAVNAEAKAHEALQIVLDRAPASDRAHQILGDANSLQRHNEAAIAEYEAVLKANPKLPGVRLALSNCLMQLNRFRDALAVLKEEQSLQPRSADVWASLGRVQQALGDDGEALASLKKATNLPGTPPAARLLLGKSLLRMNDAPAAIPQLEQALREGADASTANYLLARAYRVTGDKAGMQRALSAYLLTSRDAAERQSAEALTQDPKAVRTDMTAQEIQDANTMSTRQN